MRIHRSSASLTGPVYIPKVYNGHNKTFFTVGYEWIYSFDPSPWVVEAVPTPAERQGDFSGLLATRRPVSDLRSLLHYVRRRDGQFSRKPLPNNIIPANQINPVAAKIAGSVGPSQPGRGRSTGPTTTRWARMRRTPTENELVRVDHNVSERSGFTFRRNLTNLERPENVRQNNDCRRELYPLQPRRLRRQHLHGFPPVLYRRALHPDAFLYRIHAHTRRAGIWLRWDSASTLHRSDQALDTRALKLPRISPNGYSNLAGGDGDNSNNGDTQTTYNTYESAVNVTNVIGKHTLRSGRGLPHLSAQRF